MPASSKRSSMSVVRRYTSASDRTRSYCGGNSDDKANSFNKAQASRDARLVSSNALDGPSTIVAQFEGETSPTSFVAERPRRQKRRSLKLTVPSIRPGRRQSWSLPPIGASIAALQPKRTTTPSSPQFEGVSSSPTSPKRFWRVLRSSLKDSGSKDDICTPAPVSHAIYEETGSILGGIERVHVTYCDSPASEYHSVASDPTEELDIPLAFRLPTESLIKDSTPHTPLELSSPRSSIRLDFQEETSYAVEQKDLPPVDPAYRALLPIVYGLEEITFNPRRCSLGEEYGDEDYAKFWETFGQLSAKEVLHAVYAIRSGALDRPTTGPPSRHSSDTSLLTVFCVLWAGLATILALYLYFCL